MVGTDGNESILVAKRHNQREFRRVVAPIACLVVVLIGITLMMPAISMTRGDLVCDMQEHSHSKACYDQVLVCGLEEGDGADSETGEGGHVHTKDCYEKQLICDIPEHTHSDSCYAQPEPEPEDPIAESAPVEDDANGTAASNDEIKQGKNTGQTVDSGTDLDSQQTDKQDGNADLNEDESDDSESLGMPSQSFEAPLKNKDGRSVVTVSVEAPKGALPDGAWMKIDGIDANKVWKPVSNAVKRAASDDADMQQSMARAGAADDIAQMTVVDIVFRDAEGNVIEPAKKLSVRITSDMVRDMPHPAHPFLARVTGDRDAKKDAKKYADAEMVLKKVKVANRDAADDSEGAEDTVAFKADKFGPYAIMQLVDADAAGKDDTETSESDEATGSAADADSDGSDDPGADEADADSDERPRFDGPAVSFEQELSAGPGGVSLKVTAEAPEGALPKGATMRAELVEDEAVIDAAKEAAADTAGIAAKRAEALAADITFLDAEGNPIEPAGDVRVTLTTPVIADQDRLAVVHVDDDANAEVVEGEEVSKRAQTVSFDAAEFSVYALVYTVDFHWEVDGKTYDFSLPGGGFVSFAKLMEILGTANTGNEAVAPEDAPNTMPVSKVTISEATNKFVADVENVEFSNPSLVWVGKVDADTTVGDLKAANNLTCEYSTDFTEEGIAQINAQKVAAGDWALISLKPFTSEETLSITMKSGDVFTIKVTDAQEVGELGGLDPNNSYLVCYHENGVYHVLKTDGTVEHFTSTANFDKLGPEYQWTFYYVFTEKDRETSLDYTYYFIRPIAEKTNTISLNEAGNQLVQYGTNNVAIIPQDGGFVFLGYNHSEDKHIELGYENNGFVAYNDLTDNPTIISIYKQDPLPQYSFTVKTGNSDRGKVTGRDENGTNQSNVNQYIARTNNDKKNNDQITANPVNHTNQGQNKWVFDYWDLDGARLENVGATIAANSLNIPRNGSVLTAHFKQNPSYVVPDSEKEGTAIQSMAAWLNELKNRNIPLNEAGTNKTAEVYDYENRIYRVDLTTQSSLTTFDGAIDMGFMLDVSGSMNFPSYLYNATDVTGVRDLSQINDRRWNGDTTQGERWGLNTGHTYYIISDPDGTATVCYLYYYQNQWWLCDASKDKYTGNGRFDPANGHSADNTQYYDQSYYKTTNYVIMEAGDRVTQADLNDSEKGPLLRKLGLGLNDPKTRAFYLELSLNSTLAQLDEILGVLSIANDSTKDPDVKIAWNTFRNFLPNGNGQIQHNFVSASTGINLNYDFNTYGGGTSTDVALLDAAGVDRNDVNNRYSDTDRRNWDTDNNVNHTYTQNPSSGFQWEQSASKYAVLITDGAPQRNGKSITRRYVTEAAQQLKNRGVNLVTVGLGIDNVTSGKILMYDIADSLNGENMFFSAKTGDELEDVLLQIISNIMVDAAVQGDVTDTIDSAFYPVNKETCKPLVAGNMIDLNGNVTTDASQPHGTITYDSATGLYGVKWENMNFTWEGWHGAVFVKAKEDLLGGNAVQTNSGDAEIEAKSYKTSDSSPAIQLADKKYINGDPAQGEDPHYVRIINRETPRVNVNELSFLGNNTDWTVYLGTEVDPKEQLKALWNEILVEETVKAGKAADNDQDNLPEIGTSGDGNNWYPVAENSIADDREGSGSDDRQTFKMSDLVKKLAEAPGKNYDWWDYAAHAPNWNVFLERALSADGLVIPYDVYSLQGNDNSAITITLTKAILSGEEADVVGHSPHDTAVVNDGDTSVEKYILKVLYSPDYDVLPVGQGGSGEADFHVGTFGTIYQGHAAGTELSENSHVINVFAKRLQLQKVDIERLDPITSDPAKFKLYRPAASGEPGEEIPGVEGSFVQVGDELIANQTVDGSGAWTAETGNLPLGGYWLVETHAPIGYNAAPPMPVSVIAAEQMYTKVLPSATEDGKPIGYNWSQTASINITGSAGTEFAVKVGNDSGGQANPPDSDNATAQYRIKNSTGIELPVTGGPGTDALTAIGYLLIAAGGALLLSRRRCQSHTA